MPKKICKICKKEFYSNDLKYMCKSCRKDKIKPISKLKSKADKLWRTVGKSNSSCEVCEKYPEQKVIYNQLHPHHVCGRRNEQLRWDIRNRCWLCPTHHTLGRISAHNTPRWFNEEFFKVIRPQDYEYIKEKELITEKITVEFVERCIKELEMLITK